MSAWRIDLVNNKRLTPEGKRMTDAITVGLLRSVYNTEPEAWDDLVRLFERAGCVLTRTEVTE